MSSPSRLDFLSSKDRSVWPLVLISGVPESFIDLHFVCDTGQDFSLGILFEVEVGESLESIYIYVNIVYRVLG